MFNNSKFNRFRDPKRIADDDDDSEDDDKLEEMDSRHHKFKSNGKPFECLYLEFDSKNHLGNYHRIRDCLETCFNIKYESCGFHYWYELHIEQHGSELEYGWFALWTNWIYHPEYVNTCECKTGYYPVNGTVFEGGCDSLENLEATTVWPETTFHTTIEPPLLTESTPPGSATPSASKPPEDEGKPESAPVPASEPPCPSDISDLCREICDQYCLSGFYCPNGKLENCNNRCMSETFMFSTEYELTSFICPAAEPTTDAYSTSAIFTTSTEAGATTTTQEMTTTSITTACDNFRTFDCPDHSKCAALEIEKGYTCICDEGRGLIDKTVVYKRTICFAIFTELVVYGSLLKVTLCQITFVRGTILKLIPVQIISEITSTR